MLRRKPGMTFLEIMIAMVILAIAMLPIFSMLHKGTEDTDLNASQAYAINRATEILNTLLDNVPFEVIRAGNPGILSISGLETLSDYKDLTDSKLADYSKMLFDHSMKGSGGYPCQGVITDPRGVSYLVTLKVEDVCAPPAPAMEKPEKKKIGSGFPGGSYSDFGNHPRKELTFAFLLNPAKLSDPKWVQTYLKSPYKAASSIATPSYETKIGGGDTGVALPKGNIYLDDDYSTLSADATRFVDPTAVRYTQRMASEKVNYTNDDNFQFCTMKKLIIEVQWNSDKPFFSKPETENGTVQRIHLMTMKGDINR